MTRAYSQMERFRMNVLRRTFGSVDRSYLVRGWLLGALFFGLLLFASRGQNSTLFVLYALNTLLFPFSKLVWDEAKRFVLGDNFIVLPALMLLIAKLFVNVTLWGFSIFVAPLGMLWAWHRAGARS